VIRLGAASEAAIGRLGRCGFRKGYYVYCGSAMNGLAARIARHQRRVKKLHWHVDHLLALPASTLVAAIPYPSERREECRLNQSIQRRPGAVAPIRGFGSSDCVHGCPAHLTYFVRKPRMPYQVLG